MKRMLAFALLATTLTGTCANKKYDRLEPAEKDHYAALKVWMDTKARKSFLKLKTRPERDAWLKSEGLWERFYQYDKDIRDKILAGKVGLGWSEDMVAMSWGAPHSKQRLMGRNAAFSELYIYYFEVTKDGEVLFWAPGSPDSNNAQRKYRVHLTMDDHVVTDKAEVEGW